MDIQGIPIGSIWSVLKWLPKWVLRKQFPPSRMAQLVYVDLRPRHEPATFNLGTSAEFQIWLQIINLSPFEIELDRSELFVMCGPKLKLSTLIRMKLQPGQIVQLYAGENIPDGQANHIAVNVPNDPPFSLDGTMEFNSTLHNFSKAITLSGIKPRYLNANSRSVGNDSAL